MCLRSSWGVWGPNQDLNPNFICLFVSGRAGSSSPCGLFSSVASGAALSSWRQGFSLLWRLSSWPRAVGYQGFGTCGRRAQ